MFRMAVVLAGSAWMLSWSMVWPRNDSRDFPNSHLFLLSVTPASCMLEDGFHALVVLRCVSAEDEDVIHLA